MVIRNTKNNIKKIIYVFERRHAYNYDFEMFGMKYFEQMGCIIETWTLVNWTFDNIDMPKEVREGENVYYINNLIELKNNLNRVKNDSCFFLVYPYDFASDSAFFIRKYIKKYGLEYANITNNPAIDNLEKKDCLSFYNTCFYEFKQIMSVFLFAVLGIFNNKRRRHFGILCRELFGPYFYKSKYNFVRTPIEYTTFPNRLERYSSRNILIHSKTYDEMLEAKISEEYSSKRFVVFIDGFNVGHSDWQKMGVQSPIDNPTEYYRNLCYLFDKIEKKYYCNVIIAAHPKAEYEGFEYGNREIVFGKTNDLIKHCLFALVETSTCISNIVLLEKDWINVFTKDYEKSNCMMRGYNEIKKIFHSQYLDIADHLQSDNFDEYIIRYNPLTYNRYCDMLVVTDNSSGRDSNFYEYIANIILSLRSEYN